MNSKPPDPAPPPTPTTPTESVWIDRIAEQLLWPRLMRVPTLALRPQRVVLSLFLLVLVGLIGRLGSFVRNEDTPPFLDAIVGRKLEALAQVGRGVLGLHVEAASAGFVSLVADLPEMAMTRYPVESVVLGLPIVLVWCVLGGAVCRSVACEVSAETTLPWTRHVGFALARWKTVVGVALVPMGTVGLIAGALALAGVALFNQIPGLELVGSLLFGLAIAMALVAIAILAALFLGWTLLLPAAVCEGTDAIDATGRVLAYVAARPIRLIWYLLVGGLVSALAVGLAFALVEGAIAFARAGMGAIAPAQGIAELTGAYPDHAMLDANAEVREVEGLAAASARIIGAWGEFFRLVAMAYALSCVFTLGTMAYLFIRQVCDGQHYAELWAETEPSTEKF